MCKIAITMVRASWLVAVVVCAAMRSAVAAPLAPIVYTVQTTAPEDHAAEIEATIPVEPAAAVELMMPVWSPGYYKIEDYAERVQELSARSPDGAALAIEKDQKNR